MSKVLIFGPQVRSGALNRKLCRLLAKYERHSKINISVVLEA